MRSELSDEPLRLLRTRGHWALEVTRMVPVDRHVLRPERRRVSGADSVVRHLKERCAPTLVREALDLIVGQDDGFDRAFEPDGEHWIQVESELASEAASGSVIAALVQTVSDLRVELTSMRALHEALRGRIAHLERRVTMHDYARCAARPAARREPAGGSLRPAARTRSVSPGEAAKPGVSAIAATELSLDATPAPAPIELDPATKPLLAMPQHADVVSCLRQLLGADPELRQERGGLPKDSSAFYAARVIDAADAEVGVILFDKQAGVELGGRLLGLPPSALGDQVKGELSADMLDAMNEVVNNLSGFINRANIDMRVRVRPLETYDGAALSWLAKSHATLGSITKNGGRLWLAAR